MRTAVIVGPTGSGKTGLAIEIAREVFKQTELRVEIISADSRAIFKEMNIGTAKPSLAEQKNVKHWGIDLVNPDERFTVVDFKKYAEEKIKEIRERGATPLLVGGTGLYVDALIYDYQFTQDSKKMCSDRKKLSTKFKTFGIKWSSEEIRERIKNRLYKLFIQELFEETEQLVKKYSWNLPAMKSNIYKFAWNYMRGEYDLEKAIELAALEDYHLAKRQMTWFKRNPDIEWLPIVKMKEDVIKFIQDEQRREFAS